MCTYADPSRERNSLEPNAFMQLGFEHPPETFDVWCDPLGHQGFSTDFDLLTTAPQWRERVLRLPAGDRLLRMLTLRTAFLGSPFSEFMRAPAAATPSSLVQCTMDDAARNHSLVVVKDLPHNSPLVSSDDNAWADAVVQACREQGFAIIEGMALAYVPIDFNCEADYLSRMSKARRKDMRRKLKSRDQLDVVYRHSGDAYFDDPLVRDHYYALYEQVHAQSTTHFDKLSAKFFDELLLRPVPGSLIVEYWHEGKRVAFNYCLHHDGNLVDKYIGMEYPVARQLNLYFVSWMINLEVARSAGCRYYIAGWTDPAVKAALGARFSKTRHAVYSRHACLRVLMRRFGGAFEIDRDWPDGAPA